MKNHSEKLDGFSHMLGWHSAAMARIISILSKDEAGDRTPKSA